MTGDAVREASPDADWLRRLVREIPDFPEPGVRFRDITPLLADPAAFHRSIDELLAPFADVEIDTVVGIEARGFIVAAPIAYRLGAAFVPVRKAGKLPWAVAREEYVLEYRAEKLELHRDAIRPGERGPGDRRRAGHRGHGGGHLPPRRDARGHDRRRRRPHRTGRPRRSCGARRPAHRGLGPVRLMGTVDRVLPWRRHHEAATPAELTPLLTSYRRRHPKAPVATINRAYQVAAAAHRSQLRNSGESYINHPLSVARIVADIGLDEISVAAALLHDAVEDTEITLDDVDRDFGAEIAEIVDGLTKLERIRFDSREAQQAATMRKMLVAMARDLRVLVIKLADRLAQHADAGRHAAGQAAAHRPGDDRHLRPAGPPAGDPGDQAAARGPVVRRAAPEALRRARPPRRRALARARRVPRRRPRRGPAPASTSSASTPR